MLRRILLPQGSTHTNDKKKIVQLGRVCVESLYILLRLSFKPCVYKYIQTQATS